MKPTDKTAQNNAPDELLLITNKLDMLVRPKPFIERLGAILSSWSQVAMLAVVVYGYVYTVIPVLQKEQISEELAKLEIEKDTWDESVKSIKDELIEKEKSLVAIDTLKEKLKKEIEDLLAEKEKASQALYKKEQEYTIVSRELADANKTVEIAIHDLLEQQKLILLGKNSLPSNFFTALNFGLNNRDIFSFEKESKISESLAKSYPNPYENADKIIKQLNKLRKSSIGIDMLAKEQLYNDYKKGLDKNSHLLMCPKPNFEEWESNFIKLKEPNNNFISSCEQKSLDAHAVRESWTPSQLKELNKNKSLKDLKKYYSSSCKISVEYNLQSIFREAWDEVVKPCRDRVFRLNSVVLGDVPANELEPFNDISPPSMALVERRIKEAE
jgi:hypothetical protein